MATSPAWLEKAGAAAFADANARLRAVLKESLAPALAACMQAAEGADGDAMAGEQRIVQPRGVEWAKLHLLTAVFICIAPARARE